jgi:hypothetical protein
MRLLQIRLEKAAEQFAFGDAAVRRPEWSAVYFLEDALLFAAALDEESHSNSSQAQQTK